MSTLQQFIDDFLQGNGDDAINAALGHEFIPPPEPSPGPLIEVGCARLRLGYDTATPHAGFKADIWSGPRRGHYTDGLERLMNREPQDIRKLLDRWVPWSRHVDTVPPPPGALAVRWSSFEHMRTYARNARAA